MVEYIDKAKLYEHIAEREELARDRALDTPVTLPFPIYQNPAYIRYTAQLNERTAFKHMVTDFPSADVVQVVRCKDCKNWQRGMVGMGCYWDADYPHRENDFCSRGEKREEE